MGGNRGRARKKVSQQTELVGKFPKGGRKTGTVMCRDAVSRDPVRLFITV